MSRVIECEECKYLAQNVIVIIRDAESNEYINDEVFKNFCALTFKPVINGAPILGCSEGEPRERMNVEETKEEEC